MWRSFHSIQDVIVILMASNPEPPEMVFGRAGAEPGFKLCDLRQFSPMFLISRNAELRSAPAHRGDPALQGGEMVSGTILSLPVLLVTAL